MKPDSKHLTLEERKIIQTGIENRSNKVDIARTLAKDPTTIAKEIRLHRILKPRNSKYSPILCANHTKLCGRCLSKCELYKEKTCKNRDRSPGACNKCAKINTCTLDHYFYYASKAFDNYKEVLVSSREGLNITDEERKTLANIIVPLIKQGQSVYHILVNHPEIKQSERCIYYYIEMGLFREEGLIDLDLKEKVKRKTKKFNDKYKKRKQPSNYINHTYDDYLNFKKENPYIKTTEMDTVYNTTSGPYIQTFIFEGTDFMIGFLHKEKTSESMSNTFNHLQSILNDDEFSRLFGLMLTDRGSEFEKVDLFLFNPENHETRLNIFYCDPMQSSQKPNVENNHNYVRDIIPNEVDISNITQDDVILAFNHINSSPRESLNGKTPYEMFEFIYSKDLLNKLGVSKIPNDDVVLKPYLLKHIYKN